MDAALKQRLVGASVIIALAVIFIPMIFDDSNRVQNQSISIEIPDEPSNLKRKVLSLDSNSQTQESNQNTENQQNTSNVEIGVLDNDAPIKKQESILEVVDNSKNQNNKTKSTKPKDLAPVKDKKTAPKSEPKIKPVVKATNIAEDDKGPYRIKLGSFSSQKNAQQLKAQIIHKGYKAIVEKDNVSGLYKVFSNQINTLKQANEMNLKIQRLKLNIGKSSIEKLDESTQLASELQLDSGWILQIGSFSSKENSLKMRDKIRKKGFVSFVDEIINSKKQLRYRVRIGPYATREEVISEQSKVIRSMNLKSIVKPHEKQRVIN